MATTGTDARGGVAHAHCRLAAAVVDDATVVLQIAPAASAGTLLDEDYEVLLDGRPIDVQTIEGEHGGRIDVMRCSPGELSIRLESTIDRSTEANPSRSGALDVEQLTYLRQSRYCPSDILSDFANRELDRQPPSRELLTVVADWVRDHLSYEEGASGPLDSAIESLDAGRGVCRDFAHVAITMLRALDVPSRLVAVYAPGLTPMDFHAVVEAHVEDRWWVIDPTRLAPRPSLLRVATGRDAADTAFFTSIGGDVRLHTIEITAFTDGDLPLDDHTDLRTLD